ncbi:mitochondrial tRNA-specific 2-thiouridylase 1 isoform X3 [Lingula anatina]|uniref:tRNA-5-taurinomethyluridine 2-sulfurtransferase n=1 Tax=Lingula anatina TaxID=7574 RepID=A0A1S3JB46_LINAN|nr:mitochondrial tRNA-specific 2-thiouridylase 1 isoform X3 [Lingula anatina]|eukprot:XP_013407104.1 mitochondrial tRNA-specific 2-thiouridylase 1 isoform X3 [Lingula anatina]
MLRSTKHIVCALSGGLDSAVAAFLLKSKGFTVSGVHLVSDDPSGESKDKNEEAAENAHLVCKQLGIPLQEVHLTKEYWDKVFRETTKGNQNLGLTSLDAVCNKHITFGTLISHVLNDIKAHGFATGHGARLTQDIIRNNVDPARGVKLLRASEQLKDQTYSLSQVSQRALQKTVFPVGELPALVVRDIAVQNGLDTIVKKGEDSSLCSYGRSSFQRFVKEHKLPKPGRYVDLETSQTVGEHDGAVSWTVGQQVHIQGHNEEMYVAEVLTDVDSNTCDIMVVSNQDHPALFAQTFFTRLPHWIHEIPFKLVETEMLDCEYQQNHGGQLRKCTMTLASSNSYCGHDYLIVSCPDSVKGITPGQHVAFYKGEECLGSAQILRPGPSVYAMTYGTERRKKVEENTFYQKWFSKIF